MTLASVAAVLSACASGTHSSNGPTGSTPGASSSPKGPASAHLTFTGDRGLAGQVIFSNVNCEFPQPDGSQILFLLGSTPGSTQVAYNIHISAGNIDVLVASGSGQSFISREFAGAGVTNFDGAKGAQIDTRLTETTAASAHRGTIGAITSVKGAVDCGNQTTGTSTVVYTGSATEGAVTGGANPFQVRCNSSPQGMDVSYVGIVKIGGRPVLFITTISAQVVNVFISGGGSPPIQHNYRVQGQGLATVTAQGAHVAADLVEQNVTSGSPHKIHVEGDLTCG